MLSGRAVTSFGEHSSGQGAGDNVREVPVSSLHHRDGLPCGRERTGQAPQRDASLERAQRRPRCAAKT